MLYITRWIIKSIISSFLNKNRSDVSSCESKEALILDATDSELR